jgi:hypothetical protein
MERRNRLSADMSLDEEVWSHLEALVQAGHSRNRYNYIKVSQDSNAQLDSAARQKLGLYVWYLLRRALRSSVGGSVPTDAELSSISEDYAERFSSAVPGTKTQLEDTFRYVYDRPPVGEPISTGQMMFFGLAALGVLYSAPEEELAGMKPKVDTWWVKHRDNLSNKGLLL